MLSRGAAWLLVFGAILTCSAAPGSAQTQAPAPAQSPTPAPDLSHVPLNLDRIRDGVQREKVLNIPFLDPNTPVFRVHVEEGMKLEDYWKIGPDTAVSRDVRASFASAWHHDFLSMTTPKQHIAASPFGLFGNPVHPVGLPVDAIGAGITKAIKGAWRDYQLNRIRAQIQEELRQIEENREREPEKAPASTPTIPPPPPQ